MRWWNHQKRKKAVRKTRKLIFLDWEILKLRIFGERISGLRDDLVAQRGWEWGVNKFYLFIHGTQLLHVIM